MNTNTNKIPDNEAVESDGDIASSEVKVPRVTLSSVGARLCEGRNAKNLSFDDAHNETNIRIVYLKAMESGDFDELPGSVYTRGYLQSYAECLGLDEDEILSLYDRALNQLHEGEEESSSQGQKHSEPVPHKSEFNPGTMVVVVGIILALLIYGVWLTQQPSVEKSGEKTSIIAADSSAVDVSGVDAELARQLSGEAAKDKLSEQLTADEYEITVIAVKDAVFTLHNPAAANATLSSEEVAAVEGVDISADEALGEELANIEVETIELSAGDTFFMPSEEGLFLTIDDSSLIEIYVNGNIVNDIASLIDEENILKLEIPTLLARVTID